MHSIWRRLYETRQVSLSFHPPVFTGSRPSTIGFRGSAHPASAHLFPNITEALFHRRGERNACVKSPALIASLTARVPFSHSKADLPSLFRQMHMPTATLPSSGEQSNPLLKKWLTQILASILFFRWVKKERKKNDLTNYFRSSCSNLAECIW